MQPRSTLPQHRSSLIQNTADLQWEFPHCFEGIGCFTRKYHIILKADARPIIHSPLKYPIGMSTAPWSHLQDRGTYRLGLFSCLCMETEWQSLSMTECKGTHQLHQEGSPQDPYCWDHTQLCWFSYLHKSGWDCILLLCGTWWWITATHSFQLTTWSVLLLMPTPRTCLLPRHIPKENWPDPGTVHWYHWYCWWLLHPWKGPPKAQQQTPPLHASWLQVWTCA